MKRTLLFLLVFCIPVDSNYYLVYKQVYHAGVTKGISINLAEIILFILYFLWFFQLSQEKNISLSWPRGTVPALGFIVAGMLSIYNAPWKTLAFYQVIVLCKLYLLFFYLGNNVNSEKEVKIIVSALMLSLAAQSSLAYLQLYTGKMYSLHYFLSSGYPELRQGVVRPEGTFGAVAPLAAFLAILLPITLGVAFSSSKPGLRTISLSCSILGVIVLVLTLSRGGWISFAISFFVMAILSVRNRFLKVNKVFAAIVVMVIIFAAFSGMIISRFEDPLAKRSLEARTPLIEEALSNINNHPFVGVGINNYWRTIVNKNVDYWNYLVHNTFLLVWAETGTIGLLFFLGFFITVIRCGIKASKHTKDLSSVAAICVSAGLIGHAFHMFFDVFNGYQFVSFFWVVSAFLVASERLGRQGLKAATIEDPQTSHGNLAIK